MCEWGTDLKVENLLAFNGDWHRRTWKIDACIAPIVEALNRGGIDTTASCCGHGKGPGRIDLADGRILRLDPFGGSGTTALVATGHGRDCILIDLDERNYHLALDRVGPFILERAS